MFREMRRKKQALTQAECIAVLQAEKRGVLAVHGEDGYPYALPMNFFYRDGTLYFHCAKTGHKLDALAADDRVSFCVMDEGVREDGDWPLHFQSVIVFGRVRLVAEPEERLLLLRELGIKYLPAPEDVERELEKYGAAAQVLALSVAHMTGKRVKES